MVNDEKIIIRTRDFKMGPDVELYVQSMKKNGILENLSKEKNLNAETLRNTPLEKMCDIFDEKVGKSLQSGDLIIFGETGNFEIYAGEGI